jgi:hypothetical protein
MARTNRITAKATIITSEAQEMFVANADAAARELERQVDVIKRASKDAKTDTRMLVMVPRADAADAPPHERVTVNVPAHGLVTLAAETVHDQIADRMNINRTYYRRMMAEAPDLLSTNVNHWFNATPGTNLVRLLGATTDDEGHRLHDAGAHFRLRGFLGGSYRPLDNAELLAAILPTVRERGAYLREFSLTDQRLHARFATFERGVEEVVNAVATRNGVTVEEARRHATVNGRDVSWVNELMRMGVSIRNSETGFASLDVAGFMEVLKCLNGLIVPAQVKRRHVGGRRDAAGEFGWESEATQRLGNAHVFSQVTDAVMESLSEQAMARNAGVVLEAKVTPVALPAPMFEFLGRIGESAGLNEAQVEILREETQRATVEEGGVTRFALSQGWTALARRTPDFDKRTEWERTGFAWLTDDATRLAEAGREPKKGRRTAVAQA